MPGEFGGEPLTVQIDARPLGYFIGSLDSLYPHLTLQSQGSLPLLTSLTPKLELPLGWRVADGTQLWAHLQGSEEGTEAS